MAPDSEELMEDSLLTKADMKAFESFETMRKSLKGAQDGIGATTTLDYTANYEFMERKVNRVVDSSDGKYELGNPDHFSKIVSLLGKEWRNQMINSGKLTAKDAKTEWEAKTQGARRGYAFKLLLETLGFSEFDLEIWKPDCLSYYYSLARAQILMVLEEVKTQIAAPIEEIDSPDDIDEQFSGILAECQDSDCSDDIQQPTQCTDCMLVFCGHHLVEGVCARCVSNI